MSTPHKTVIKNYESEIRRYLDTLPSKFRSHYENATLKLKGRKSAVTAKCLDCVNYENAANRIRECETIRCPLWRFRPYQVKQNRYQETAESFLEETFDHPTLEAK